jgi:glycosyltransferase involved in cell wall biosynthesis
MKQGTGHSRHHPLAGPLKVVRIISGLWPGGVEKKLTALLPLLNRDLFDVKVVCLKAQGELAPVLAAAGIPVIEKTVLSRWSPKGLWTLARYLKREGVDIVHTHMYRSNVTGTVAARLAGVPVIIANIHNVGSWDDAGQVRTDRFVSRFRQCTVFVSEAVKRDYLKQVPLPDTAQKVLYNGVDTEVFKPGNPETEPALHGEIKVGAAARLMPQKNLHLLVKAAADPVFQKAGVHFFVAGEGPLKQDLLTCAKSAGASGHFHLLGFNRSIRDFYQSLDLFAMPSLKEGFSNALLEAMACGLPVVATAVGGNPEAVRHGVNGLLVPPDNDEAFLAALRTVLENAETRHRMGHESARIARSFSLKEMVRQTEELYLNLWLNR